MEKRKIEIREEFCQFIEYFGENCTSNGSLFDEIRKLQTDVDFENEVEKYRVWLWKNSIQQNDLYDKIPHFLDIEIDYQYNLGSYLTDGLLPMSLKFNKKYQTTNGDVKECVMESLIQRIRSGDITEHPFHSIELGYDMKKDKHLSLRIESKPLKTIQMLYKKYSENDYKFLKQFYIDNFLGDSELVTDELEVV